MKIPSHLNRSRHGVYYYRAIIPKHLRANIGQSEIKRSLHTKEPKQAKFYALHLNLLLRKGLLGYRKLLFLNQDNIFETINLINIDTIDLDNIQSWTLRTPQGITIQADANNPDDLASAEKLATSILGDKSQYAQFISQDDSLPNTDKIHDLMPGWIARLTTENHQQKTIDEYVSKLKKFAVHIKATPVNKITAKHVSDFVSALSIGAITGKPLSPNSVNKYIVALTSFFHQAQRVGIWPDNKLLPTTNQRVKKTRKTKAQSYRPFSTEDLGKIFNPENINWTNLGGNDFRPHMLWLPLLALFTGARIEELCQLSVDNIYQDHNAIWVMDINEEGGRHLKTDASTRKTPLHPTLIQLGFIDYIDDIKMHFKNEKLIFPYLIQDKYGKYSSAPSKWFARYLHVLGITDQRKVFHSFRSTANNVLKEAEITEETRCQLIGHEYNSTNSKNYSKAHTPKWLFDNVLPKLQYPTVPLSELAYKKGDWVNVIAQLLTKKCSKEKHKVAANRRS